MIFPYSLVFFAASCFAADPPTGPPLVMTCAPPPASRGRVPSLWEYTLDQHPTLAAVALEMGDWQEHSEELYAFAFGHYLGNKVYSPVQVEACVTDIDDCSIFVDYAKLFSSMSSMTDSFVLYKGYEDKVNLNEFREKYFDYERLQSLSKTSEYNLSIIVSSNLSHHCSFGQLRTLVAECANNELATTAFDVAILKWLVRAIEDENSIDFFSTGIIDNAVLVGLFALELNPHVSRLCRRELDIVLDRFVSELQNMPLSIFKDTYVFILNIFNQVNKSIITEKILPKVISKGLDQSIDRHLFFFTFFRSFDDCQCKARLLLEKPEFQRLQLPKRQLYFYDLKIHAAQSLLRLSLYNSRAFPIRSIFEREYLLQADILNNSVTWSTKKFTYYDDAAAIVPPVSNNPLHVLCVICQLKPSPNVVLLLTNCKTEADLKALFRTPDWRYMTLAFSMTVAEVKAIR